MEIFERFVVQDYVLDEERYSKLNAAGKEFATECRREIDAAVARMKADATVAEEKLQKLDEEVALYIVGGLIVGYASTQGEAVLPLVGATRRPERYGLGEISRTLFVNGASFNASTYYDWTNYYETLASDRLELALQIEADRMVNLNVDQGNFASERDVVKEEYRQSVLPVTLPSVSVEAGATLTFDSTQSTEACCDFVSVEVSTDVLKLVDHLYRTSRLTPWSASQDRAAVTAASCAASRDSTPARKRGSCWHAESRYARPARSCTDAWLGWLSSTGPSACRASPRIAWPSARGAASPPGPARC